MKQIAALLLFLSLTASAQTVNMRAARPRVLGTTTEWGAVAAKKNGNAAEQAQYNALVSYVNSKCPASVLVNDDNQGCAAYMGVLYRADPATWGGAFATKACALAKYIVDRDDGDAGGWLDTDGEIAGGNPWRWYGISLALAWDALQPHCDTVDATVGTKVRYAAERSWFIYRPDSTYPNGRFYLFTSPYKIGNNIGVGQVEAFVKLAAAAYEPGTYEDPASWLYTVKTQIMDGPLTTCITATTASNSSENCYGGSMAEGIVEYGAETITRQIDLIDAYRVATTDVDYWPTIGTELISYVTDFFMHATSPTGPQGAYYKLYQMFTYRDVTAGSTSSNYYGYMWTVHREVMGRIAYHLKRLSLTTRYNYAQWWIKNIQPVYYVGNPPSSQNSGFQIYDLRFEDPNDVGSDYRGVIGLDHVTPVMFLSRNNWTENATWAGFFAMSEGGDHMHGDPGTFHIWRKGKWLTREMPGYAQGVYARNLFPNASHNSLTLNGHGSYSGASRGGGSFTGAPRFQRRTGGYMATCNDVYCSAQADLSPSYKFTGYLITADVNTATRDFFHLKANDIFVVADRIKYSTGVTAPSIFHVQSEKAAAAISGNMATISNASQRLHVTKVFPPTADFLTPLQNDCKVIDVRRRTDDQGAFFFDCYVPNATTTITLSGFTGAYSVFNGTNSFTRQSGRSVYEPFSDGIAYNGERFILNSTGLFAGLPAYDPEQHGYASSDLLKTNVWNDPDINPTLAGLKVTHNPYRLDIHSGRRVNEEAFLVVMQGADSTDTAMTVAALTSTTSNATGAAFTPTGGSLIEVIAPTLTTPTFPMSITRTGDPATHYVFGMTPGSTYKIRDALGVTTIDTTGSGTSVVANNAGILTYSVDTGVASPTITLVATPSSLSASCVSGGSNPANQTVALTVTGDGGEAAVSVSDDSAAISETLSGGAAPQNTPQTMTVAFGGCSGLSVGTHNLTISVTSGTTYVVNSPLTIPVTVTVTADPLIAASPASVNFTATVSGANPDNQTVTITRTVSGDLGSITDDAAWLTVTPSSATGITSQDLTLAVDIAGLDPGQHTATITVASSGASNTPLTIPVLLALDNPPVIGLEPRPGTTMIQFRYLAPSRAACTVRACTSPACSSVVASSSDGGGHPIRIYTLTGLTAATTYTVQTNCAGDIKARQVTTRAATGGPTITLPIDVFNAVGADNIVVDYGADDTLSETAVNGSCSGTRCTATITWSNANRLLWFQVTFRDSGNNVLKTEAIRSRSLIPE